MSSLQLFCLFVQKQDIVHGLWLVARVGRSVAVKRVTGLRPSVPRAVPLRETVEQSVERAAVCDLLMVVKMTGLLHFSPWSLIVDNEYEAFKVTAEAKGNFRAAILLSLSPCIN